MTSEFSTEPSLLPPEFGGSTAAAAPRLNIKRMLRLRMPLILGVSVALAIPSALAVFFLTQLEYEATADLRFSATTPRVLYNQGSQRDRIPYHQFVNTQLKIIERDTILSRVLDDPEVRNLPILANAKDPLAVLKNKVNARAWPNNELVTVAFRSVDRNEAITVVKKVISVYMDYASNEAANIDSERLMTLRKNRDTRQNELDLQLQQIVELQRKLEVPLVNVPQLGGSDTEAYRGGIARAEEDLSRTQIQAVQTENLIGRIKELQEKNKAEPSEPLYELDIENRVTSDGRVGDASRGSTPGGNGPGGAVRETCEGLRPLASPTGTLRRLGEQGPPQWRTRSAGKCSVFSCPPPNANSRPFKRKPKTLPAAKSGSRN